MKGLEKHVICPCCGYSMPILVAKNAKCVGLYAKCKNQKCKKFFEIRIAENEN